MHEAVRFTLSDHFPLHVCGVVMIVIHVSLGELYRWWK